MSKQERPLKMGMVGGGRDAFIGAVHRNAAALDGQIEFVAGALSSTPEKAVDSARDLGLAEAGYRILANTGEEGGQEVPHLHIHIFGGRPLGPMLSKPAG